MRKPNPDLCPERAQTIWNATQSPAGVESIIARCKLITPMYGGGVKEGEVDRDLPIRASSLRGQLRFWWRLLNSAGQPPATVFSNERALWGGISNKRRPRASQVTLRVKTTPVEPSQLAARSTMAVFPSYALILERGDDPFLLTAGYEFELALHFSPRVAPQQREQVIEALRWWASFGGVGARTRRGLGAVTVTCDGFALKPVPTEEIKSRGGSMVLRPPNGNAVAAWTDAVNALKEFRQGRGIGRTSGGRGHGGRSHWPEPDTVRDLTGRHTPPHVPQHPARGHYPRAAFGLPIIFHFKDRDRGDPSDQELTPGDGHSRMASPLVLRPYYDGRAYRAVALLLPGWEKRISVPVGIDSEKVMPAWPQRTDERMRLAAQIEPMRNRDTDALSAFMHYFANDGRGAR